MVRYSDLAHSTFDASEFEAVLNREPLTPITEADVRLSHTTFVDDTDSSTTDSISNKANQLIIAEQRLSQYSLPESWLFNQESDLACLGADHQQACMPDTLEIADLDDVSWWALEQEAEPTIGIYASETISPVPQSWSSPCAFESSGASTPYDTSVASQRLVSSPEQLPSSRVTKGGRRKKEAKGAGSQADVSRHRRIEKKYRNKIADGLDRLRAKVACLVDDDEKEAPNRKQTTRKRRSKTTIICKAVEYIEQLEQRCETAQQRVESAEREINRLRQEYGSLRLGIFRFDMDGLGGLAALPNGAMECNNFNEAAIAFEHNATQSIECEL